MSSSTELRHIRILCLECFVNGGLLFEILLVASLRCSAIGECMRLGGLCHEFDSDVVIPAGSREVPLDGTDRVKGR